MGAGEADDEGDKHDDQRQPQGDGYGPPTAAAGAPLQLPAGPSSQRAHLCCQCNRRGKREARYGLRAMNVA